MDEKEIINILLNIKKKDESESNQIHDKDLENYSKCEYCKVLIRKNNWSRHKLSKSHLNSVKKEIDANNNIFKKFNKRIKVNNNN